MTAQSLARTKRSDREFADREGFVAQDLERFGEFGKVMLAFASFERAFALDSDRRCDDSK